MWEEISNDEVLDLGMQPWIGTTDPASECAYLLSTHVHSPRQIHKQINNTSTQHHHTRNMRDDEKQYYEHNHDKIYLPMANCCPWGDPR